MTQREFNKLLRDVSRSFYLTMRFLPQQMREPVSLGYMLARASDTLADTAKAPLQLRIETLSAFREAVLNGGKLPRLDVFFRHQSHEGERTLLKNLEPCFSRLQKLDETNQAAIRDVLDEITKGQLWDLKKAAEVRPRPVTSNELDHYTYSVAGCVGEFWTRIGFWNLGKKFADSSDRDALMDSGKHFGKGLQLINILRDIGEDLENGRCYLPVDFPTQQSGGVFSFQFQGSSSPAGARHESDPGLEIQDSSFELPVPPAGLSREMKIWQAMCRDWLVQGWDYLEKVRHHRVRFATALPLIIGERTLVRLEAAGEDAIKNRVKIDRTEVKQILWKAWWARKSVERLREI